MNETDYRNALYEVNEIFGALDQSLVEKVPEKLIDKIKSNKSENYAFKLDLTKPLKDQKLLKTTKEFLAGLYFSYWADEQEKNNMKKRMLENERRQQEEFDKNFKESIFNPENQKIANEKVSVAAETENAMVEVNENYFKKFMNKLVNFFSRNK